MNRPSHDEPRPATPRVAEPDGALLRLLIATSSAAVVTTDRDAVVTSWNAGAELMMGYAASEIIGRPVSILAPPNRHAEHAAALARVMAGERLDDFETVRLRKDGAIIHAAVTVAPLCDATGQIIGATVVARDISQCKQADEVRDSLLQIIDHSREFIAMADLDGRLTYMNAGGRHMIGVAADGDLASLSFTDYVPLAWRAHFAGTVLPGVRTHGLWEGEMQLRHLQTGALIDVARTTFLLRDAAGQPSAYATVTRDITASKRAETALRQAAKLESLGTFAASVAHDFNNITAVVLGFAQLAATRLDAAHPVQESLGEIVEAAERARALVRQLMDFARPAPTRRVLTSMDAVVEHGLRSLRAIVPPEVELVAKVTAPELAVLADCAQLERVILNLGTNAWHALGSAPGRVTVGLETVVVNQAEGPLGLRPGRYAVLSVGDTGRGMDQRTREHMFDPFFTTKGASEGTGLGLAIVHRIVEDHDGAIDVTSQPGQGTTIRVFLPVGIEDEAAHARATDRVA